MSFLHHSPEISNPRLAEKLCYPSHGSKGLLQVSPFLPATMVEKEKVGASSCPFRDIPWDFLHHVHSCVLARV